jgi:hypothetical protein
MNAHLGIRIYSYENIRRRIAMQHQYWGRPEPEPAMPAEQVRRRLAPHETLELHELLASKNAQLYNMKKSLPHIADPELRQIYAESMQVCSQHIRELVTLLQSR